jgi:hypothetical protein
MTRMGVLLAAGTMAFAATACWADGPVDSAPAVTTGTSVIVETVDPAHAENGVIVETDVQCGSAGCAHRFLPSGECARKFWDWMTYCPQTCRRGCSTCTRTCAPTCVPPLYTYFQWYGGSNCGGACSHAPCGVATAVENQPVP